MRIDAHQHFWDIARGDYGWLTSDSGAIYRDFCPDDLAPSLKRHGITATILVQAAPTQAETDYLLGLADSADFIAGVVGWLDFDAPDAVRRLQIMAANPLLVGIRPMIQDIADDDWLARDGHHAMFEALAALGLVFDALVLPHHLPHLLAVARSHRSLAIVIDHLAKPSIASGALEPWQTRMEALSLCRNVSCKLSGMVTEAGADWTIGQLRPFFRAVFDAFGQDRLLWGSDWPVVDLAGGYDRWCQATDVLLAGIPAAARTAILGGNAALIYLAGALGRRAC